MISKSFQLEQVTLVRSRDWTKSKQLKYRLTDILPHANIPTGSYVINQAN